LADSLSLSRLAFAALILRCESGNFPIAAFILFVVMDVSDVLDGLAARRFGCQSAKGAALDSGVDFAALLAIVIFDVQSGDLPVLIPALMAISFGSFVLETILGGPATKARVGKYSGAVLYFVLTAGAAGRAFFPPAERTLAAIGVAVSAIALCLSVMENGISLLGRLRTRRTKMGGPKADRPSVRP